MSKRYNQKRTPETTNNHVNFGNSHDGQMLLNSISAAFYLARKENEYNGEFGIMKSLFPQNKRLTSKLSRYRKLCRLSRRNLLLKAKKLSKVKYLPNYTGIPVI